MVSKFVIAAVGSPTGGFGAAKVLARARTGVWPVLPHDRLSAPRATRLSSGSRTTVANALGLGQERQRGDSRLRPRRWHRAATRTPSRSMPPGNVLSAYESGMSTFLSRTAPAGGTFAAPRRWALPSSGYTASTIAVGFDAAGNAAASWVETDFNSGVTGDLHVYAAAVRRFACRRCRLAMDWRRAPYRPGSEQRSEHRDRRLAHGGDPGRLGCRDRARTTPSSSTGRPAGRTARRRASARAAARPSPLHPAVTRSRATAALWRSTPASRCSTYIRPS